jgi:hypothetical protein
MKKKKQTHFKQPELGEASLIINELISTANNSKNMRKLYLSIDLRQYMRIKNNWTENDTDNIWWLVHEKAMNKIKVGKRRVIQKFIHNKLPTNERQHTYYEYKSNICKACNKESESQQHIFSCKGCKLRNTIRNKYLLALNIMMENHRTEKNVQRIISNKITQWVNGNEEQEIEMEPDSSDTLIAAKNHQGRIGWDQWIKGRWSQEWCHLHNYTIKHTDCNNKFNKSEKWANDIIMLTWDFVYDIWNIRNKIEHDEEGDPNNRKREKLKEVIWGISEQMEHKVYNKEEVSEEKLSKLSLGNLEMIENNLKNERGRRRKNKKK